MPKRLFRQSSKLSKFWPLIAATAGTALFPILPFCVQSHNVLRTSETALVAGRVRAFVRSGKKNAFWGRAYERLKAFGEEENMLNRPVVFRNGALAGTSAWANAFLERDHHASRKQEEE